MNWSKQEDGHHSEDGRFVIFAPYTIDSDRPSYWYVEDTQIGVVDTAMPFDTLKNAKAYCDEIATRPVGRPYVVGANVDFDPAPGEPHFTPVFLTPDIRIEPANLGDADVYVDGEFAYRLIDQDRSFNSKGEKFDLITLGTRKVGVVTRGDAISPETQIASILAGTR